MKLTIGMATYEDFDGVYFTVQALRMYQDLEDCEILVIDNKPNGPAAAHLPGFMSNLGSQGRYIAMPEPAGTTQSRNRVFAEARGDAVLCIDCHVLLRPGAIAMLKAYYGANPTTLDLYGGPILWDDLHSGATHYDPVWRAEMWGIWSQAWECGCRGIPHNTAAPLQFSSMENPYPDGVLRYGRLDAGGGPLDRPCPRCGKAPPPLPFDGHQAALAAAGYRMLGYADTDPVFEVPGQGLGLFTCRREAWLGFNPAFTGFGGEELYIHDKYRKAGRRAMCLPWLRWGHRFARPHGTPFPLGRGHKVRNYVLGAYELAAADTAERDRRLAEIKQHFVTDLKVTPLSQFERICRDPAAAVPPEYDQPNGRPLPPDGATAEEIAAWCLATPRDLNEHVPKLAELAAQCSHVTEFSGRRESTVGLFAGIARSGGKLMSYNTEEDQLYGRLSALVPEGYFTRRVVPSNQVADIEPTDLLFLDSSPHNYEQVRGELAKYAARVRRYIVFHDTVSYGANGEGSGPGEGLRKALAEWVKANPAWFVTYHTDQQYGLTVLGCNPADRPPAVIHAWPPGYGPGTELKAILVSLGWEPKPNCSCTATAEQMDKWGVAGCEEHFDKIVQVINDNMANWGWAELVPKLLEAAAKAIWQGIVVNPAAPVTGLVRLAIQRAKAKEWVAV